MILTSCGKLTQTFLNEIYWAILDAVTLIYAALQSTTVHGLLNNRVDSRKIRQNVNNFLESQNI